jgi:DNA-binding NtrC family response regulator
MSNTILRAIILSSGRRIGRDELDLTVSRTPAPAETTRRQAPPVDDAWQTYLELPLTEAKAAAIHAFTRYYLEQRLAESGGNVSRAAARAGMQRPNFKREMRKVGVGTSLDDDPTEEAPAGPTLLRKPG